MTNEMINASDNALVNEELEMYNQRLGSFDNLEDAELSKEELEALLGTDADDIEEENTTEEDYEDYDVKFQIRLFNEGGCFRTYSDVEAYNTSNNLLTIYREGGVITCYSIFNIKYFDITRISK